MGSAEVVSTYDELKRDNKLGLKKEVNVPGCA
jgi:hypothetical protein